MTVHHLEEAIRKGGQQRSIVGIAGVDLHRDIDRLLVEGRDRALGEGQRVVVDGEIAEGEAVAAGDREDPAARRVDQLRAIAVELEAVQLPERERPLDPVAGVLLEVDDDVNRPGLARLRRCLGDGSQRFGEGRVGVAARRRREGRHVEAGRAGDRHLFGTAFAAEQRARHEKRGKRQRSPAADRHGARLLARPGSVARTIRPHR
ncbi:hypothetical protein [Bradyrhizobium uaiense]|uniref:Uncharacterized protein n=1 Tax=Bradyrhizobium uaiense TaxID=2594946 RepID=A0A6P1BQK9_9BRAD|nr:hypothetical protein [Bradyrhizobium uaiense]NEV00484.1 hypothetical protein [Bradyrhizobium uaiense]